MDTFHSHAVQESIEYVVDFIRIQHPYFDSIILSNLRDTNYYSLNRSLCQTGYMCEREREGEV